MSLRTWPATLEALALLTLARVFLALTPAPRVLSLLSRPLRHAPLEGHARVTARDETRRAIFHAWRMGWLRNTCYHRAIAAHWMLRRRHIPSQFHYGALTLAERGLTGHVWLTDGAMPVVGGDAAEAYKELIKWG